MKITNLEMAQATMEIFGVYSYQLHHDFAPSKSRENTDVSVHACV